MKKGFFFLRECENQAVATCSVCGRKFCSEHMRMIPGKNEPACLDCLGKQLQAKKRSKKARETDSEYDDYYYDSVWCYGYRHSYYRNNNYEPWYDGNDLGDDYYSELDVRSFDDVEEDLDSAELGDGFQAEENVFDS